MTASTTLRRYGPAVALMGTAGLLGAKLLPTYNSAELARTEARSLRHVKTRLNHLFIQAGSNKIHTVVSGTGPPLVLLHGHGGGIGVWYNNYDTLSQHFRIYAIDWLGWGRSERPAFDGKTAQSAVAWWLESLESWRQAMGLTDFFLLGHSLGGWFAAEYALAYGQHIRHLLLENPAGLTDELTLRKGLFYYISPQRLVQNIGPFGPQLVEYGRGEEARNSPYDGDALLEYYYHLSMAPLSGQLAFQRILNFTPLRWQTPLMPRAEQLKTPTTILWGLKDELLSFDHASVFQSCLPQTKLVTIPNAHHSPHIQDPKSFHAAVIGSQEG